MTPKQRRFVQEYLIDGNGTQAAIRAGYAEATARQIAAENLTKPVIADAIEEAEQKRNERLELSQDWVLKGIRDEALAYREQGKEPNPQAALRAYELLGRHFKMFTDKIDHGGDAFKDMVASLNALDGASRALPSEQPSKANGHANGKANGHAHD